MISRWGAIAICRKKCKYPKEALFSQINPAIPVKHSKQIPQLPFAAEEFTPANIYQQLRKLHYIGQEKAVKALSLMACRHINRLKYLFVEGIPPQELPPKDNFLLLGPTGSGKTYLVNLIFSRILKLPTTVVDLTAYSETGYVGQDVVSILTRLVLAAGGDYERAAMGIVCLDEFDKLATSKSDAVFSGQGTTKDVSGLGVQKELLKMLEGAEIDVPLDISHSAYAPRQTMSTEHIAFIALGAFSGITKTIRQHNKQIGFGQQRQKELEDKVAYQIEEDDLRKVAYFQDYGIMPELIGRFTRIIPFHPLGKTHLKTILQEQIGQQYHKELELLNTELLIEESVMDKVVEQALEMETGARALRAALYGHIEAACFELYSQKRKSRRRLRLFVKEGHIQWEINALKKAKKSK